MKFGKLPDITDVDFSIPEQDSFSLSILGGKPASDFQAYIGLPRWSSKEWIGKLYPKGTPTADYLKHYSASFNCIELNTTHYRIPTTDQVQKWYEMAEAGFHFCPKIPQIISHYRKLLNIHEELTLFADAISFFREKLGPSFLQLHDSFSTNLIANLEWFVEIWPKSLPLAIEFRHESWFEDQKLIPDVRDLLTHQRIGAVITDVAGRRDVCHTTLTSKFAVIRFVGNALHPTDYSRTDAWIERIAQWKDQGLEQLYLFAHEPGDALASELGEYWINQLNDRFNLKITTPGIKSQPGSQMELF